MLDELVQELKQRGFVEGSTHEPGDYAIERGFPGLHAASVAYGRSKMVGVVP